ncbi:MAG TPA: hypothetical protein VJZ00_02865 [Thermoanaerobaculia bacterium]|nr:hypothetical protein [Thermoanaerobaculia bacterium]
MDASPSSSTKTCSCRGTRPTGFYLRVGRNGVEKFRPELLVWNAAEPKMLPARVPIVREQDWLAGESRIERIPVGAGVRATVRIYSPDDDLAYLRASGGRQIVPSRPAPDLPRFASFDLTTDANGIPAIDFLPKPYGARYFVLITFTDPRTGQLAVVTAQPARMRGR